MSSIVVAPLGAEQVQEPEPAHRQGRPTDGVAGSGAGTPDGGVLPGLGGDGGRARGWRAVRPRTATVLARAGRRVAAASHDAGMATAEYAIATLAAVGFAGLLVVLLKSGLVRGLLTAIIRKALQG